MPPTTAAGCRSCRRGTIKQRRGKRRGKRTVGTGLCRRAAARHCHCAIFFWGGKDVMYHMCISYDEPRVLHAIPRTPRCTLLTFSPQVDDG